MLKSISNRVRNFWQDCRGDGSIELIIIMPALFWVFAWMVSMFDTYRQESLSIKAANTIADMISRETQPIDQTYLNNSQKILATLVRRSVSEAPALRVSMVRWDAEEGGFIKTWSKTAGTKGSISTLTVPTDLDRLPALLDQESVLIVETFLDYKLPFKIGINDHTISSYAFVRPRFSSQILWQGQ